MKTNAPNNGDADRDGIPDGVDEYDWEHNTLFAENAGYTNLVLTVVQGMDPPAQNAPRLLRGTPNASVPMSAMLDIGGLKIPAYTGTTIPLGIPYGEFHPFIVSVRGNSFVQVQLFTAEALYADGDTRIFTGGTSASSTGRLAFPRLYLVPQSDSGLTCLHEGDTGVEFRAILQPVDWSDALDHAIIEGFELRDNGRLWLAGTPTQRPGEISDGTVTLQTPWLFRGTLSESASVHWCEHGGTFCYACGVAHTDVNPCSHEATCAAKYDLGGGFISYNVLKEDGSTLRSITRRFTMANAQIKAEKQGTDSKRASEHGTEHRQERFS